MDHKHLEAFVLSALVLSLILLAWHCRADLADAHQGHDHIPPSAEQYRRQLIREVRYYFGLNEPVSPFAAQIHQESAWRSGICSPYACGLGQQTEATAQDLARMYPKDLEGRAAPLDPHWSIRAMVLYMRQFHRAYPVPDYWEERAFSLARYNGGSGHVQRERTMAKAAGADPNRWFLHVERFCKRAAWACRENRDYPRKILFRWEPLYRAAGW